MAHAEMQQALQDVIEAIEVLESLLTQDSAARAELRRKLARARMHLREARQDMRASRLGESPAPHTGSPDLPQG
jgi:uncharacterized coiled-coil protein SlyX